MQRTLTTADSPVNASSAFEASRLHRPHWRDALGRLGPALRAAWFVCLLAATALAGGAPGVIDIR